MFSFYDLELSLHRLDANTWQVDFRFSQPASDADIRLGTGQQARAVFDLEKLVGLLYELSKYAAKPDQPGIRRVECCQFADGLKAM